MFRNTFFLFYFLLNNALLIAGNGPSLPENILKVMEGYSSETGKITYLHSIIETYQYQNPNIAKAAANEAYVRANAIEDKNLQADALYWLAWLSFQHENELSLTDAMAKITFSISLYRESNNITKLTKSLILKSAIALDSKDLTMAKKNLEEAEQLIPQIRRNRKDSLWVCGYVNQLKSNLFPTESQKYQEESLRLFEQCGDSIKIGRICLKLAGTMASAYNVQSAIQYTQRAAFAFRSSGYSDGEHEAFVGYISALIYEYSVRPSERLFNQIYQHATSPAYFQSDYELQSRVGIAYSYKMHYNKNNKFGKIYRDSANYFLNKAWENVKITQNIDEIKLVYDSQKYNCAISGECDSVYFHSAEAFLELLEKSNVKNIETQNALTEIYNSDRQRDLNAEQNWRRNFFIGIVIAVLVIGLVWRVLNQRRNINEMNRQLKSRMEALRAQMNPHFISNALNAIDSLVNQGRNKEASHYIIQFSRLCRVILNNSRYESVTLDEEIQMLTYFLNLEQLRMGDRLKYKMDIDPALNIDQIAVPSMILQPFVENSIWHGLAAKSGGGMVLVQIKKCDEQSYQCIVEDDGVGRQKSAELKAQMITRPSLGLAITEERIEKLHKIKGSHIVTEDLHDNNGKAAGTRVTITLPIQNITEQQ